MEERECVTHAKDVLNTFGQMKDDEKYCDFTLVIGDEEIPVHRMVLAASSKYFDAMFSHDMAEKKTSRAEILGIEPSIGKQCIEYAYTGKMKFSRENPRDLIHAAEMMQLDSLIDLYFNFLMEGISAENCLEYMEFAQTYNKENFAKVFEKFLTGNFDKIIKTDDFASMTEPLLHRCLESLSDGACNTEKIKWEAIVKWTEGNMENRQDSFPELFKIVNFKNLPTQFMKDKIWKEPLVKESSEIKDNIFEALCARDQQPAQMSSAALEEAPTHILAFRKESRLLHKYDLKTEEWSRFLRIPSGMTGDHIDIVSLKNDIYVGNGSSLSRCRSGTWTKLFNTGYGSCYCRCLVRGSDIVMVTNDFIVRFDSKADHCEKIRACCDLGHGFTIAASKDFLYAIGGKDTEKKFREFDFTTKTWEPLSSMKHQRICGSLTIFCGRIIALGGYHCYRQYGSEYKAWSEHSEYYHSILDKWFILSDTETNKCPASNFKTFVIGNKLYLVGDDFKIEELKLEFGEDEQETMRSDAFFTAHLGLLDQFAWRPLPLMLIFILVPDRWCMLSLLSMHWPFSFLQTCSRRNQ